MDDDDDDNDDNNSYQFVHCYTSSLKFSYLVHQTPLSTSYVRLSLLTVPHSWRVHKHEHNSVTITNTHGGTAAKAVHFKDVLSNVVLNHIWDI